VPLLLVSVVETAPEPAAPGGGLAAPVAAFDETTPANQQGSAPIRVGGAVQPPVKIRDVRPFYPAEAQAAGVAGVVIIEAVISGDGTVQDARVLRGVPMLDQAALDAVRQWRYIPPLLNGQPVSVIMTVTINFTLDGAGAAGAGGAAPNQLAGESAQSQDLATRTSPFPDDITRVGGEIPVPRKVFDAKPIYPEEAKAAGVQGVVILEVLLDEGGFVADVHVLRAHEMLEQAAVDAVRQWRYEPILLDGRAVQMVMTVTVNFTLSED
jgi:protein TonB